MAFKILYYTLFMLFSYYLPMVLIRFYFAKLLSFNVVKFTSPFFGLCGLCFCVVSDLKTLYTEVIKIFSIPSSKSLKVLLFLHSTWFPLHFLC